MWLHAGKKSWPLSCTEQKSCNFQSDSLFFLISLHFICFPAARPSSVVLWRAEGVFSSLTNVVQIACSMTMGELLNLGHTLFVVAVLLQPILLSFFSLSSPLPCFSDSVKWKNSCLTSFQSGCCVWTEPHVETISNRMSVSSSLRSTTLASHAWRSLQSSVSLIIRKYFYRRCFLVCLFVVFKDIHFLQCKQYSNILGWGGESAGVVCSWRWHSMLWYSNGVIHQQALLKHLDKPAEATPVAMVTILKVDVCSQTVAAKIFNTIDMDLLICLFACMYYCVNTSILEIEFEIKFHE